MDNADNFKIFHIIDALRNLYVGAHNYDTQELLVLDPTFVRRELFKLYYTNGEFCLNQKADAAEAFQTILELIHASLSKNMGQKPGESGELYFDDRCNPCFVHIIFKINTKIKMRCKCGNTFGEELT